MPNDDIPTFDAMKDEGPQPDPVIDSSPPTETIHLDALAKPESVTSGSFDLRWIGKAALGKLLEALPLPILFVDEGGAVVFANKAAEKFADQQAPVSPKTFTDLFPSENDAITAGAVLREILADRKPRSFDGAFRLYAAKIWGKMYLRSISVSEQRLILVLIEDMTAEKKQLLLNEKYRKLVDLVPIGIVEFVPTRSAEPEASINEAVAMVRNAAAVNGNGEFARIQGFQTIQEALGRSFGDLFPYDGRNRGLYIAWIKGGFQIASSESEELTPSGETRIVENTLIGMSKSGRLYGFWLLKRDVTARRRVREDVTRAQKLESLGLLAGGIAHDFNNILTALLGNINLAKMYTNPGERIHERLTEAERASWRAKGLTGQLLTFSRGGLPVKRVCLLGPMLRESTEFSLRGSNVRVKFDIDPELRPVEVDEGQMSQVINNLVINACQAMPSGGSVTIEAHNVEIGPAHDLPLSEGPYVKITVTDEGTGIAAEHLQRIFDPYFTTKPKGSGLGLATSYSIIKAHGGFITVQSARRHRKPHERRPPMQP